MGRRARCCVSLRRSNFADHPVRRPFRKPVQAISDGLCQRRRYDDDYAAQSCQSDRQADVKQGSEVTLYFWIIKVMATTVGETGADFLNTTLNLGLTVTTFIIGSLLIAALFIQFRARRYVPSLYWLSIVLISVVGTLITDNLTDNFGVSLVTTTILFAVLLAATFAAWHAREKSLSIHSISTTRREAFARGLCGRHAGSKGWLPRVPEPTSRVSRIEPL
jgi:Repeat of Unknown Function (DUF347)